MANNPPKQERPPFTSSKPLDLLAWISLLLTIGGTAVVLVKAAAEEDVASIATAMFMLLVALCVVVMLLRRHSPKEPPRSTSFHPFDVDINIDSVWRRPDDTQRIVEAIHDSGKRLPVVVGSSGVGKTTLLNVMVPEMLSADVDYIVIDDDYEGLKTKLEQVIPDPDSGPERVIVLDQFEQWLAYVRHQENPAVRDEERRMLKTILRKAQAQPNCTVLLSVRREWFYELHFLGELIPPPADACGIEAPEVTNTGDVMRLDMLSSFAKVVKEKEIGEAILERIGSDGTLSPLEVQLVGAFVENRVKKGNAFSLKYFDEELGGVGGAIDTYFKLILDGAARPSLCMKILCALSLKTRFREQTKLGDIRASLYERDEAVDNAMEYLEWYGLVQAHTGGAYELAHDFLAEWFSSKSGTELHPIERDNILAYVGAGGRNNGMVLTPEELADKGRIKWGLVAVVSLLVVMTLRLFYFGLDWSVFGPSLAHPVAGSLLDASYIPVVTPYAAWIVYVSLFYDRVLIYLREPRGAHLFSVFIVLNLIISTVLGMVIPFAWLLGIATGGLAFAGKLLWLSRHPDLNRAAQRRLSDYGVTTMLNLLFVGAAGAVGIYAGFNYVQADNQLGICLVISLAASALMTYWCLILTPRHVSRSGVSQLLGLIGRPNTVTIASSSA